MADYLKGLFGAQKAPPPANEDGTLQTSKDSYVDANISNFYQTSQILPKPQILLLLPSRLSPRSQLLL